MVLGCYRPRFYIFILDSLFKLFKISLLNIEGSYPLYLDQERLRLNQKVHHTMKKYIFP